MYEDQWRAYSHYSGIVGLPGAGFQYEIVNYSVNFVDPHTGLKLIRSALSVRGTLLKNGTIKRHNGTQRNMLVHVRIYRVGQKVSLY